MTGQGAVIGHNVGKLYRSSDKYYLGVYSLGGEPLLIGAVASKLYYHYDKDHQPTKKPRILVFDCLFPAPVIDVKYIRTPVVGEVRPETKRPLDEALRGYTTEDWNKPRDMLDATLDGSEIIVVMPADFDKRYGFKEAA